MLKLLTPADYITTPWKNGLGSTTEITRDPAGTPGNFDFDWRLSAAAVVEDGPFSTFPGIERTIVTVSGAGMDLTLAPGQQHRLLPLAPFTFDGAIAVTGRLIGGPVRDFNVMVRRAAWSTQTIVCRSGHTGVAPVRGVVVIAHALVGGWLASSADGHIALPPDHTLLARASGPFDLSCAAADAALLLATLTPVKS